MPEGGKFDKISDKNKSDKNSDIFYLGEISRGLVGWGVEGDFFLR